MRFWSASAASRVPDAVRTVESERCRKNWYEATAATHSLNRYVAASGRIRARTSIRSSECVFTIEYCGAKVRARSEEHRVGKRVERRGEGSEGKKKGED